MQEKTAQLVGKFKDRRLVIAAGGRCVWDDIQRIRINTEEHDMMAVNDVGMHLPFKLKHWYSNDSKLLPRWLSARRPPLVRDIDEKQPILTHSCYEGMHHHHWPVPGHGTSGLNAVYVALLMGYEDIVLVGMPLDDSGHYFDAPWMKTNFTREVPDRDEGLRYWSTAAREIFDGRVKAVSGRLVGIL